MKNIAPSLALVCFSLAGSASPVLAQQPMDWVPRGMEEIGRTAAFHTDFTFDKTMLQMASGVFYGGEQEVQHAVAKLNGISVHSYRFAAPGMYDPRRLQSVRQQYEAAGWKHLVSAESRGAYNTGRTDLWINFQHMDVTGMVLLLADGKNLNLIALNGDLSPLDLLHLRGHFGIPRFSGDHFETPHPMPPRPAVPSQPDVPRQSGEKPSPYPQSPASPNDTP